MADNYGQWFITKMFTDAEAAAVTSGKQITFKKMIASQDIFTQDDLATLTNSVLGTIDIKQQVNISTVLPSTGSYKVQGVFSNFTVTADYLMNTILLVGSYNGAEFLAAAQVANNAFKMPAASTGEQTIYNIAAQISVSNTATVSLTVDPDSIVTNAGLKVVTDAQAVKDSAQDVKISSLETKDAQNVKTTGNQTIGGIKTFTEKIIGSITGTADKAVALVTGRNLKVKLDSTADRTFDGTADAADIGVSGILPITNGGTGNASGLAVGQSSGAKLTATDDLNNIATTIQYTLNGEKPLNAPTDAKTNYGFVIVQTRDDNGLGFVVQRYITTANEEFIRSKVGQPLYWTTWTRLTTDLIAKQTLTLPCPWGNTKFELVRIGNMVTIHGDQSMTVGSTTTYNGNDAWKIGDLPAGFKPALGSTNTTGYMAGSNGVGVSYYVALWVNNNGDIVIQNQAKPSTSSSAVRLFLSGSWITSDPYP